MKKSAVLFIITSLFFISCVNIDKKSADEVKDIMSKAQSTGGIISNKDIEDLPDIVKKYFEYTGVAGKKRISSVSLKQKVLIRKKPDSKWISMSAEQYYTSYPYAFVWKARTQKGILKVKDSYFSGQGNMLVSLAGFKLADATNKDITEASLMRYLNEMIFFPTALLDKRITWSNYSKNGAKVSLTDNGVTVDAIMYFENNGKPVNFIAQRFNDDLGKKVRWETPYSEYKEINGFMIPVAGSGIWYTDNGPFEYVKIRFEDIVYKY